MMSLTPGAPEHVSPAQWQQALGYSRQSCARVFRDGGTPADAIAAFGMISTDLGGEIDWERAVDAIAGVLCTQPVQRAA